jgi:hypothetical protein
MRFGYDLSNLFGYGFQSGVIVLANTKLLGCDLFGVRGVGEKIDGRKSLGKSVTPKSPK